MTGATRAKFGSPTARCRPAVLERLASAAARAGEGEPDAVDELHHLRHNAKGEAGLLLDIDRVLSPDEVEVVERAAS